MQVKSQNGIIRGLNITGGAKEKQIIKNISKYFLVTFSRDTYFKYSHYYFNFLKPSIKYRRMFNLFNEVLFLFTPYPQFDTRTLDFVDKTLIEFDNRLDKICILIASPDLEIENKIQSLNNTNKESKIIIPFTYNELLTEINEADLENKFRKYFYSRDLFAVESPLKSENYFYGRNHTIQSFYDKYCIGEHAGLFGLRKIGKTSVLYGLERMIKLRNGLSVYIDCQDTAIHKARWFELLYIIIQTIKDKYSLDVDIIPSTHYDEKTASSNFTHDLKLISSNLDNKRILIIFDEVEHISFKTSSTTHWQNGLDYIYFWQTIRAVYQKNDDLFCFIIAGVNPLCIEQPMVSGYDNPIFSLLKPVYLELFDVNNVTEMISSIGKYMGLEFESEIFTHLTDDYGGHPFLIRHVCSLINSEIKGHRPIKISKYTYREQKQNYDTKIQPYVELIISVLQTWYPEEYNLLETLVCDGNEAFKSKTNDISCATEHLFGYGIIRENNGKYYVTINAVENYIMAKSRRKKNSNTKEGRWAEISERRNALEHSLRRIIGITLQIHMGRVKACEEVSKLIDPSKKLNFALIRIEHLMKELYLKDLKELVIKNWTYFEKLFNDKRKFEMYLDLINQYRIDAHAKDISDEDFDLLRIALSFMEKIIESIEF